MVFREFFHQFSFFLLQLQIPNIIFQVVLLIEKTALKKGCYFADKIFLK